MMYDRSKADRMAFRGGGVYYGGGRGRGRGGAALLAAQAAALAAQAAGMQAGAGGNKEVEKDDKQKEAEAKAEAEEDAKLRAAEEEKERETLALADYVDDEMDTWAHHPKQKYRLRALLNQINHYPDRAGVPPVSRYSTPALFGLDDEAVEPPKPLPSAPSASKPAVKKMTSAEEELAAALAASAAATEAAANPTPAPAATASPPSVVEAGGASAASGDAKSEAGASAAGDSKDNKDSKAAGDEKFVAGAGPVSALPETDVGDLKPPKVSFARLQLQHPFVATLTLSDCVSFVLLGRLFVVCRYLFFGWTGQSPYLRT